jgi:hypothetical protein
MPTTFDPNERLPEDDPIYSGGVHFVTKHPRPPVGNFVRRMGDGRRWGVFYRDAQGNIEDPRPGYVLDTRREAQGLASLLNLNERNFGRTPASHDDGA